MKSLLTLLAVCAVAITLSSNVQAEQVSKSTLNAMGLSAMTPMSDADGLAVRGMGYVQVSGWSFVVDRNRNGDVATAGSDYFGAGNHIAAGISASAADSGDRSGPSWAITGSAAFAR